MKPPTYLIGGPRAHHGRARPVYETLAEGVATAQAAGLDDTLIRDYFSWLPVVAPGLRCSPADTR